MQPKPLRDDLLQATVEAPTFITAHDIATLCRVSDATVSRWARFNIGGFPSAAVKQGPKLHLFATADYVRWATSHAAQRGGVPVPVDKRTLKRQRHA